MDQLYKSEGIPAVPQLVFGTPQGAADDPSFRTARSARESARRSSPVANGRHPSPGNGRHGSPGSPHIANGGGVPALPLRPADGAQREPLPRPGTACGTGGRTQSPPPLGFNVRHRESPTPRGGLGLSPRPGHSPPHVTGILSPRQSPSPPSHKNSLKCRGGSRSPRGGVTAHHTDTEMAMPKLVWGCPEGEDEPFYTARGSPPRRNENGALYTARESPPRRNENGTV